MSATTGNYLESLDRISEGTPCRLCMKKNDYYYNIFTSIVASQTTVEDALYDLVDLKVVVGDGLPATLCPLCLKKLIKFYDFRNICHESDAELRKISSRNNFRSFEGGAAHDNSGPSVETKGCIQDVIEKNSQPTCSAQTTEIYLPVPDLVLPRDNELFQVKGEDEGNLSEGIYPMLYTSDPAGISTDVSDPLATDELSNAVTYKCPSVKEDHISDDEDGYRLNDCTDGASSKLIHQDISGQPITLTASQGEKVETQGTGAVVVDLEWTLIGVKREPSLEESDQSFEGGAAHDNSGPSVETKGCIQDVIEKNSQPTCSAQTTEIYLPVPDLVLPRDNELFQVKGEDEGNLSEGIYPMLYTSDPAGISTDVSDPLATDELSNAVTYKCPSVKEDHISDDEDGYRLNDCTDGASSKLIHQDISGQPITLTASQGEKVETQGTGAVVVDLEWTLIGVKREPSLEESDQLTLGEHGDPIERSTVAHDTATKTFGVPAAEDMPIETTSTSYLPAEGNVRNYSIDECTGRRALVTQIGSNAGSSLVKTERNLMDERMTRSFTEEEESTSQGLSSMLSCIGNQCNHVGAGEKERPYSCSVCAKCFTRKGDLITHERIHTGVRPYSCNVCKKSFTQSGNLHSHMRTHAVVKPYSCNECEKSFSDVRVLARHVRKHTGEKPYSCSVCYKSFSRCDYLDCHMRSHRGERHSCNMCSKTFTYRSNLHAHIRTHRGGNLYACNECEKSFSSKYHLVTHISTHTGEKPFTCNLCEKSFSQKSDLNRHVRTHRREKPYSCTICSKSFTRRGSLNAHIRTHIGKRRYSCKECEMSYSNSGHLVTHIRTHTGERPFTCNLCEKSFSNKSHLVRHARTHSGKKPFS